MLSLGAANKMIKGLEGSTTQNTSCKGRRLCSHYQQCAHNSPVTPLPGEPITLLTFITTRHTCGILTWTCACVHTHRGKTSRLKRRYQELIITNTWLLKQCIVYMCELQRSMRISSDFLYLFLSHHIIFRDMASYWTWARELAKLAGQKDLRDNGQIRQMLLWLLHLAFYTGTGDPNSGPSLLGSKHFTNWTICQALKTFDDCMVSYR